MLETVLVEWKRKQYLNAEKWINIFLFCIKTLSSSHAFLEKDSDAASLLLIFFCFSQLRMLPGTALAIAGTL